MFAFGGTLRDRCTETFQISRQAISCITCKSIKVRFQRMDETIAFFFYENGISFKVTDSSTTKEESMRFAKQNVFQSYKAPSNKR